MINGMKGHFKEGLILVLSIILFPVTIIGWVSYEINRKRWNTWL